ncbi:MAG: hypothetical protein IJL59_02600 [Clostridia bacterium]|nr:hypothetical protein [Clostridia bacterium]
MVGLFGTLWLPCLILFLIGIVFFIIELCLPGFGLSGCSGVACFAAIIIIQYTTNSPTVATVISAVMAAVIIALVVLFIRSINQGMLFRSPIVLKDNVHGTATSTASDSYAELLGKEGVVETTLRPSGTVLIDGKHYTVKSAASFLEKGTVVHVVRVQGLDIVVE